MAPSLQPSTKQQTTLGVKHCQFRSDLRPLKAVRDLPILKIRQIHGENLSKLTLLVLLTNMTLLKVQWAVDGEVDSIQDHRVITPAVLKRKGSSAVTENCPEDTHGTDDSSQDEAITMYGKYKIPSAVNKRELRGSQVFGFKTPAKTTKPPISGAKKSSSVTVDDKNNAEAYFEAHGGKGVDTSDRTLSRLKKPRMSQEEVDELLQEQPVKYQEEIGSLLADYRRKYKKWHSLLKQDFNIVLFGLGSKKGIIQEFQSQFLESESVLVVNGFFPSLTVKQILNSISVDILGSPNSFSSIPEQVEYIRKVLSDPEEEDIFLLIHNIDGSMLRNDKAQTTIAQLAEHPKIHLICSIDHINAPLIWDQHKLSKMNLVWFDTTTFLPYTEETRNENSLMVKDSGRLALNSLTHVFASLTPNAKGIYNLIINFQIQAIEDLGGPHSYNGISFQELYQKSRQKFLSNTDLTLRAQLTEFIDHKLISIKKGSDGMDYLTIPLGNATLQEFLDLQKL
eukprot:maker-scaffold56_size446035-snap-gene-3.23 protein:Tk11502 transcript:maker-scaffold56_size446035-snap-gene-3.23-mRNA-1 annotation:"origin recognition complex subunit 2-like"